MKNIESEFKERLRNTSRTFRKKEGRHTLKTDDVIYCAFGTDRFTVGRHEAQRSAPQRLARFGLSRANVEGRSALDLGCHNGAMLMELTNLGPARGLGIEYDARDRNLLRAEPASFRAGRPRPAGQRSARYIRYRLRLGDRGARAGRRSSLCAAGQGHRRPPLLRG